MAGTLTIGTLSDGTTTSSATDVVKGSARAWCNWNGTGTVAIRASYNCSSITDNGTGDYTVNFINALIDSNKFFISFSKSLLSSYTKSLKWLSVAPHISTLLS